MSRITIQSNRGIGLSVSNLFATHCSTSPALDKPLLLSLRLCQVKPFVNPDLESIDDTQFIRARAAQYLTVPIIV